MTSEEEREMMKLDPFINKGLKNTSVFNYDFEKSFSKASDDPKVYREWTDNGHQWRLTLEIIKPKKNDPKAKNTTSTA